MSPAPSLSSVNQPLFRSGLGSIGSASNHLVSSTISTVPASGGGLRALRGGDVVFRASTHTTGGNLTMRRKPLGTSGSGLMLSEARPMGSR
ncbi:unnamed protein product [Echinostoma caproni]|uniref:PDZ domain-containing protein n=1 Tax=Echinostoma caproni TaxID=27848 RepID=A0A183BGV3_9TREM|nr:unnamed protein product [Echinostoma caproni]